MEKIVFGTRPNITIISDCFILSEKKEEHSFDFLLEVIYMLTECVYLADYFLLMRGGIAKGMIYHSSDIVLGPAYIEAVELEKKAKYPKIAISNNIDIPTESNRQPFLCNDSTDNIPFYDYLSYRMYKLFDGLADGVYALLMSESMKMHHILRELKKMIKGNIEASPDILLKYEWMERYVSFVLSRIKEMPNYDMLDFS